MKKEIIINQAINEVRVAITEDGELAEFLIELPDREKYVGNIYFGKVNKIVTGINAAFVNIGLNQDAFLHFSDVDESLENAIFDEEDDDDVSPEKPNSLKAAKPPVSESAAVALRQVKFPTQMGNSHNRLATFTTKKSGQVQINLEPGQEVIVQVAREAYGNKGVKVTSKIALPGRYVVLLPFDRLLGVSRKILSIQERRRLRQLAKGILPEQFGLIIRTAAKGKSDDELNRDVLNLVEIWKEIEVKVHRTKEPSLLYQDMSLATSVVRDLFTTQVQRVVIDSKKLHKDITTYLKRVSPQLLDKVTLYTGGTPIFEYFGIEKELSKTYKRKVGLPSGGDIVIDRTEAMTVIDVNSGRGTEKEQEKNAFKTNLEAAREICKQIRMRDIGGMVIIDFIDMMMDSNKKKLYFEAKKELSRDRAKTVSYPLTQLGLMQITRQRINQNIDEKLNETCPMCYGSGRITSKAVLINAIERWLKNFRKNSHEFRLILKVHPNVATYLTDGTLSNISRLMIKYFAKIKVEQDDQIHIGQFKFFSYRRQKDITNEYL